MKLPFRKLINLTNTNFTQRSLEEFLDRDLNDTKYASRFIKNFIEQNLLFKPSEYIKRRVYTFQGGLTALLRKNYGFEKFRDESLRHHALDAVVVAVANQKLLMKFTEWYKIKENKEKVLQNKLDPTFKLAPAPWDNFRDDVLIRIFSDNPKEDLQNKGILSAYGDRERYIRPLFVSRKVNQKITGPIHKETIMAIRNINERDVLVKTISIRNLTKKHFEDNSIIADPNTINVLRERMEQFNWKAEKAFKEVIYKPSKDPAKANVIKKVKIIEGPANTYVKVHKGKGFADNGAMIRVDVFKHKNKYYSVPVYSSWVGRKDLPTQYTPLKDNRYIDESFEFLFSVYPKTLLEFVTKENNKILGYYVQMGSASPGDYNYFDHDASGIKNMKQIGVVTLKSFSKLYADELGFIHRVGKEKRKPLNVN